MTQSQPGTASTGDDFAWATVDLAVLDGYAGFYRGSEYGVTAMWRDGHKLFIDAPIPGSVGAVELHPVSETDFYPTNGAGYFEYTFLRDPQGSVGAVLTRVQGVEFTLPRIDVTTAEYLKAKLSERIQSQKPLPGSEAALCNSSHRTPARFDRLSFAVWEVRAGTSTTCMASTARVDGESCCQRMAR